MAGRMISVGMVAPIRPPMTARPRGAVCEPASPRPSAIGNMPAIIAQLVIRIGRSRLDAPATAASGTLAPPIRSRSAKVTSRIALATATRSEEHRSELQSPDHLVCRLLLEKKKNRTELKSPDHFVSGLRLEKKKKC